MLTEQPNFAVQVLITKVLVQNTVMEMERGLLHSVGIGSISSFII